MNENKYEEFAEGMYKTYPKMFPNQRPGFEIDEGWYSIIKVLCYSIQSHIDFKNEQKEKYGRGDGCEQVVVVQIKEKFGGLRFYYEGGDAYIFGLVAMAENWAQRTCEVCGNRGTTKSFGWVSTLCDKHYAERQNAKNRY